MRLTRFQRVAFPDGVATLAVDARERVLLAAPSLEHALAGDGDAVLLRETRRALKLGRARRIAPCAPSKIVCVGLNYRHHAAEMNKPLPQEPLIFIKPSTALNDPGGAIVLPPQSSDVQFEGELAVVIGRRATDVSVSDAGDYIAGYTVMNDVTARDIQRRELQYTRAKGFDGFAPLGPTIVRGLAPRDLRIETRVNGAARQSSSCADLIFTVPELIAFVTQVMTLLPGDVLSTGTPSGVGTLHAGDTVAVSIAGIGTLENPVH